ncbi:MAG: cytidylate kinase-like family protein [Thermoguttaceae bacterium]|jgi:cytidylate kinase
MNTPEYNEAKLLAAIERHPRNPMNGNVADAAERQMQRWLHTQKSLENAAPAPSTGKLADIGPYLAISRESGVGGSRIARLVGETIGWDVLDRELLEFLAEKYHTSPAVLELVDETTTNWITEIFGNWINPASVSQMQYVFRLSRVILMAARGGKVIYVGRGAQFLLPNDRGLSVRLVAPLKYRVKQIMERRHLGFEEAREYVEKTDTGRQEFARQYFHHDVSDPHLSDFVINVEKLGPERTSHLIAEALASCFDASRSP